MNLHEPHLTIVIPAYNEVNRLPATLDRLTGYLSEQPHVWEIVVVSNASTDGTDELVRERMRETPHLRLLSLSERGKGLAIKAGALDARGDVVFVCDADLSMPPEQIGDFLDAIGHADIVIGSREIAGSRRFGEPRHRHVMGRIFNRIVKLIAVPDIEDTQCGFKALRRHVAQDLCARQLISGWAFDVEMLYLARSAGYSVQEIPIDWHCDLDSRVRPGVDSVAMLLEVLIIRWNHARGRYRTRGVPSAGRSTDESFFRPQEIGSKGSECPEMEELAS